MHPVEVAAWHTKRETKVVSRTFEIHERTARTIPQPSRTSERVAPEDGREGGKWALPKWLKRGTKSAGRENCQGYTISTESNKSFIFNNLY